MVKRKRFGREGVEFGRGLGFLDAIYGFAITLLVANIDLPPAEAWKSLSTLLDHGLHAQLLGFVISFVVIAVFWRHNTEILSRFGSIDSAVITSNLASAGLIVLIPFTTQGISEPEISDYPLPVALYAANVALAILSQTVTYEVGRARGLLATETPPALVLVERIDVIAKVGIFCVSIPVAYLAGPSWGMFTWLLLIPFGMVMGRWGSRIERRSEAADA